jgi:hypothetical protein
LFPGSPLGSHEKEGENGKSSERFDGVLFGRYLRCADERISEKQSLLGETVWGNDRRPYNLLRSGKRKKLWNEERKARRGKPIFSTDVRSNSATLSSPVVGVEMKSGRRECEGREWRVYPVGD